MKYTVSIRCHITGTVSSYLMNCKSKSFIKRFFRDKKDELLSIEKGWSYSVLDLVLWLNRETMRATPFWVKPDTEWVEPPEFDYRTMEDFF